MISVLDFGYYTILYIVEYSFNAIDIGNIYTDRDITNIFDILEILFNDYDSDINLLEKVVNVKLYMKLDRLYTKVGDCYFMPGYRTNHFYRFKRNKIYELRSKELLSNVH
jgi:hypothetical protein